MSYEIEKHYNKIASAYDKLESYNPRKHILISKIFTDVVGDVCGLSVLDLGCGSGFFSRLAKKQGAKFVLGIDISEKQLHFARKKSKKAGLKIVYEKGDAFNIQVKELFDIVIAGFTLSYAGRKSILQQALDNIYKHLKPGSKLFAVVSNPTNPLRDQKIIYRVSASINKNLVDGSKLRCEFYDKEGRLLCYDYKFFWSKKTFNTLLRKARFKNIRWVEIKSKNENSQNVPKLRSTNIVLCAEKPRKA